jgi:hypothetical protein
MRFEGRNNRTFESSPKDLRFGISDLGFACLLQAGNLDPGIWNFNKHLYSSSSTLFELIQATNNL